MLHLFAAFVAAATALLIFAGGLVTSTESGLSVPDWPTTYGWFMFTFPLDKMVCELQMDMVGRNEEHGDEKAADNVQTIHLVGSKRISTDLHELVLNMNKHVGFTFEYDEEDVYSRSDHAMFARKGVPIAFVFSGFHPDYHRPTDTIEKINFDKIVNTSKLFYLVAASAADAPQKLRREVRGG